MEWKVFEEDDAVDVLFLAAYEIFCEDEKGAGKHLAAVRRLYGQEISNTFMRRLQVNLEVLAGTDEDGKWHEEFQAINRMVQSR